MSIAARLAVIVVDAIVVAVTWKKTFRHARQASQLGIHVGLSATLLRDGEHLLFIMQILTEQYTGSIYFM